MPVTSRTLSIGVGEDNDWVIADRFASRQHAIVQAQDEGLLVRDRGSRNGTWLNGVRVREGILTVGGRLTLGETELRLGELGLAAGLIGESAAMQRVRDLIARAAPSSLPVLVLGESGTGKELVARALHEASGRRGQLVNINCGALPRELIESELFGHEKGAFTGAQKRHTGCFADAHEGTLFLDEIGELPLDLQPRLLRVLETGTIRAIGTTKEQPINVRIVAATHRNLAHEVAAGRFREDLFYRLQGLELSVPPLRDRPDDLPPLLAHFLLPLAAERPGLCIDPQALAALAAYPWPGNVRQLKSAVLRAALLAGPTLVAADLLPTAPLPHLPPRTPGLPHLGSSPAPSNLSGQTFQDLERKIYLSALEKTGGSCRAAAQLLNLPKSTLHDKLKRYGLLHKDAAGHPLRA